MTRRSAVVLLAGASLLPAQSRRAREHFERGRALYEEHDDTGEAAREAEGEFHRALALEPRLAAAHAYLGFLAADRQQLSEAEAAYQRALEIDPRCAEARVGLARLSLSQGRRDAALAQLRRAVAEAPDNRLALSDLAITLTAEPLPSTDAMWEEAMRCWRTLVRLDRNDRDSHYSLARACRRSRRWAEAERHFREVLRIGQMPDDGDVWVYSVHGELAEALAEQGKVAAAIREYEALIAAEGAGEEEIRQARVRIEALRRQVRR